MPHKKNPILCERLTGMARLLRSYAPASMENMALWHERDISHSSVERFILPDATMVAHYMLVKTKWLIDGLVLYPENMKRNIWKTRGLVFSQRVMLFLVEKGMSREEAYKLVQKVALRCWEEERDFKEELWKEEKVRERISREELERLFDVGYYLRRIDEIYKRFGL